MAPTAGTVPEVVPEPAGSASAADRMEAASVAHEPVEAATGAPAADSPAPAIVGQAAGKVSLSPSDDGGAEGALQAGEPESGSSATSSDCEAASGCEAAADQPEPTPVPERIPEIASGVLDPLPTLLAPVQAASVAASGPPQVSGPEPVRKPEAATKMVGTGSRKRPGSGSSQRRQGRRKTEPVKGVKRGRHRT